MPAATPRASMPAACGSLARHVAEIPLSIASMALWHRIEDLVDDDCGFTSDGQVLVAENEAELAGCRARVDDLTLARLHSRGADRRDRAASPRAGGLRELPRRRGLAPRRRRHPLARDAGLQAQGGSARRRSSARACGSRELRRDGHELARRHRRRQTTSRPRIVNAAGAWADRIAADARRAGAARGDRADADDHGAACRPSSSRW